MCVTERKLQRINRQMEFPTHFVTAAQLVMHLDSCVVMYTAAYIQLPVTLSLPYNEV